MERREINKEMRQEREHSREEKSSKIIKAGRGEYKEYDTETRNREGSLKEEGREMGGKKR